MSTTGKRLAALELAATAANGYTIVYNNENRPGHYWRKVEGIAYHGDGPAPEGIETFTQDQVDAMEKTSNVIVIQYVLKWRKDEQP